MSIRTDQAVFRAVPVETNEALVIYFIVLDIQKNGTKVNCISFQPN